MRRGMAGQDALAGAFPHPRQLMARHFAQEPQSVLSRPGNQDFSTDLENILQTRPVIADDRRGASRSLKQAHARRIAGSLHFSARHIQRAPLRVIKLAMPLGRKMIEALYVRGPLYVIRVERTSHDERAVGIPAGRLQQEALQSRLAVITIGPQISQVPLWRATGRVVEVRV